MKLREVLKALSQLNSFDLITFHDFGMPPVGYLLSDLMKYVDNYEEPVMDALVERFETRNNCVDIYGFFKDYMEVLK